MKSVTLGLMVALAASACGSSSPSADSSAPLGVVTPTAVVGVAGYCADFSAGTLTAAMTHVRKGDEVNTDLARELAEIQAWMLADAKTATDPKARTAILIAASRMGTLAGDVARVPQYTKDGFVKLDAQTASENALTAATASGC